MITSNTSASMEDALRGQLSPIDDDVAQQWRADGWWENRSLRSLLTEAAERHPQRTALVGRRSDGTRATRAYAEFDANAHRAASVLDSLGVGPGDAVVLMLPNCVEYPELVFGINEIGAVYIGIPVAYGERQVAAVLTRSKAAVLVIPRSWRSNQHLEMVRSIRAEIPTLERVVVMDDIDDSDLGSGEWAWNRLVDVPLKSFPDPNPNSVCYLGFTSGTTGEPKGAMHNHNSLLYAVRRQAEHVGPGMFGDPMVHLVASPVGHHTGFAWGILLTAALAGTAVHVDRWDPTWGAEVIREEGVTTFFGAPTFLQDMVRTDLAGDPDCPLTCLVIAGAPVPRNLPQTAGAALGAYVAPAWGMTECGILTCSDPAAGPGIQQTDGSPFAGSGIKIVDDHDNEVPAGTVGELLMRGPGVTLGYFDRPDATEEAFLPGLWFRTGDRATVDENGWLSLHGRSKDIVIRGGENIPVTDVESVIFDHPHVANVAVIGVPDTRLGERICAVVLLKAGCEPISRESLGEFLLGRGVSKHYLPERLEIVTELPMTPSGKIQKFKLREQFA